MALGESLFTSICDSNSLSMENTLTNNLPSYKGCISANLFMSRCTETTTSPSSSATRIDSGFITAFFCIFFAMARTKRTYRLRPGMADDQVSYVIMPLDTKGYTQYIIRNNMKNVRLTYTCFMEHTLPPGAIKKLHSICTQKGAQLNTYQLDFIKDYSNNVAHTFAAKKYIGPLKYKRYVLRDDGMAIVKLRSRKST